MSKPREWYLDALGIDESTVLDAFPVNDFSGPPTDTDIHVIEYAAYDNLQSKLWHLEKQYDVARENYDTLKAENKRLELVSNRLRNSWREDTEALKVERDTLKARLQELEADGD